MSGDQNKWEWQGKTREQVEFSTMMAGLSIVAMIVLINFPFIGPLKLVFSP